jgi:formylmethanofuran dehydrogenase subunit E
MSVDPGDVTRQGLVAAGLTDALFGLPVTPGNMTLTGNIRGVPVLGIAACALFHQATSLDILLPRILAGLSFTRAGLARMGHGGLCLICETCSFPHCPFGA